MHGVDIRVIVDFDDIRSVLNEFEVHAVEPIADQASRSNGGLDNQARGLLNGERLRFAVARRASWDPLDDLPVIARHVVLAGVQRLSVEHTDAPVEVGGHERLCDNRFRFVEQLLDPQAIRL